MLLFLNRKGDVKEEEKSWQCSERIYVCYREDVLRCDYCKVSVPGEDFKDVRKLAQLHLLTLLSILHRRDYIHAGLSQGNARTCRQGGCSELSSVHNLQDKRLFSSFARLLHLSPPPRLSLGPKIQTVRHQDMKLLPGNQRNQSIPL